MGRSFESVRQGVKRIADRWALSSRALKKEDRQHGEKLVELAKKAYNSPVCQNIADLHLTWWPPMTFKLRQIQPVNFAHPDSRKSARTRI